MRIFLDIGGYRGHSTLAALDPVFGFDRIFCFEPVPDLATRIRAIGDPRLVVIEAALSDRDGFATLHHAGTLAGSLFSEAPSFGGEGDDMEITTLRASSLLPTLIPASAFVRTKFNCEGAEALIICDILESNNDQLAKQIMQSALIDFDIDKIERGDTSRKKIERALADKQVTYLTPVDCQYGMVTNYGGVRNYLIISQATKSGVSIWFRSLIYNFKIFKNPEVNGYHKMKILKIMPFLRRFARTKNS